ncbi:NAD(P)H-binding protein [Sphingomonas cannabina]|uniref:SDR family oxidoreductase n=1 Tax=Sphingomonas cannabina TaxID=2899123 RepID=UPI001F1F399B|nr:NAD(P)H-binding protein [Sphingomonas cannabina]UIJ45535.1 NAD(P)H-binding protein [Sphingomonas cannabina]
MRIVVVGGTGLVGSKLVEQLKQAGHEAVVAARSTGVDTVTGEGLARALDGAEVVVDVSNPGYADPAAMLRFFEASGAHLLAAERQARVRHHVIFSAIGSDRVSSGYFVAKNAQEALVADAGIPFTIVRSAPLFEYVFNIVDAGREEDAVRLPPVRIQPIAADDAVAALMRVALGPPENAIVEVAGPDSYLLSTLAEQILTADEDYRPVLVDEGASFFGARLDDASLTAGAGARIAGTGFEDWLRRSLAPA